jgi:5-carboxyvanillate decarboxylase
MPRMYNGCSIEVEASMEFSKRNLLFAMAAGALVTSSGVGAAGQSSSGPSATRRHNYRRYACEEAFSTPECTAELSRVAGGIPSMKSGPIKGPFMSDLLDLDAGRLQGMDAAGIDVQILSLVSPGVQVFDPTTAVAIMRDVNDRMAAAIQAHPTRFGGLATVAPQAPAESAKELQRAIHALHLNGAIINSHTNGEYLDDAKYWPILEAIEALDIPLYIHPRDPSPGLAGPLDIFGFAVGWGYAVETGTHAVRLIGAGVFDRFPKLRIVLGHLGETLPFLLERLDNRYLWQTTLFNHRLIERLPSEYFRDNFLITTSGMNYSAPLKAALSAMGPDKVLFAADHPMEVQKDAVTEMEAIDISPAVKAQIFEKNVQRVFNIA